MFRTSALALAAIAAGAVMASSFTTGADAAPNFPQMQNIAPKQIQPIKPGPKVFPKLPPKIVMPLPPKFPKPLPPKVPPKFDPPKIIVHPHYIPKPVYVAVERPVYVKGVAAAPAPGPCTCLTKEYTLKGEIVFRDLCTQETASALIAPPPAPAAEQTPAPQQSSEAQSPNNFAGKTYQDFLAANGQTAQAPASN